MSKPLDWMSIREAAERAGRAEGTVRGWVKSGRVKSEKVGGRVRVCWADVGRLVSALDAHAKGRPPKGRTQPPDLVDDPAMPLAEFAERAGLNQRTVQRMRRRGEIHRYTERELARVLEQRASGQQLEVDAATADAEKLREASITDIRRAKEYQAWRLAKLKADREEGLVLDADKVAEKVVLLAGLTRASFEQMYLTLPQRLADKSAVEIRDILTRYVREQLDRLADVESIDVSFDANG